MLSDLLHTKELYEDPSFPYTMFTIDDKECTPPGPGYRYLHWHEDLQFTMVTKGELTLQVNGILYHLHYGDALFINCGLLHMAKELSQGGQYVSFNFPPKMLSVFRGSSIEQNYVLPYTVEYHYPVLLLSNRNPHHREALSLLNQMKEVNSRINEYTMPYHIISLITALWFEMLSLFGRCPSKTNNIQNRKQDYLHLMLSYIHQHYASDLSLKQIADSAHLSVSECSRCFKNLLHITPYEYLLDFRITKSTELLVETNYSVAEIANMSGFNDSSHFIQYFKKIHKQTPNQYRNNKNSASSEKL